MLPISWGVNLSWIYWLTSKGPAETICPSGSEVSKLTAIHLWYIINCTAKKNMVWCTNNRLQIYHRANTETHNHSHTLKATGNLESSVNPPRKPTRVERGNPVPRDSSQPAPFCEAVPTTEPLWMHLIFGIFTWKMTKFCISYQN